MNWEQLQKDVEAYLSASEPSDRYALMLRAPDLAALALAGRQVAHWLEGALYCPEFGWSPEQYAEAHDALTAFRKAEGDGP